MKLLLVQKDTFTTYLLDGVQQQNLRLIDDTFYIGFFKSLGSKFLVVWLIVAGGGKEMLLCPNITLFLRNICKVESCFVAAESLILCYRPSLIYNLCELGGEKQEGSERKCKKRQIFSLASERKNERGSAVGRGRGCGAV